MLVQSRVPELLPVAEATTLPSTTRLTEVLSAMGEAFLSEARTSSRRMCPQPPVAVSVTTIWADLPLRSLTSQLCQLSSSRLRPVAERTTLPSTTSSTTLTPEPPSAPPSGRGLLPPPMRRLR